VTPPGLGAPPTGRGGGISAIVLTLNEAHHIVPCLRTLQWADEQIVVDSGSTDGTRELAAPFRVRILERAWDGWAAQRNFAAGQALHPWVFFVDADERVPVELAEEIRRTLDASSGNTDAPVGYWVPRQNLILGHWMQHAGWSPDHQLRLFRTDRGRYDLARPVHELVSLDGPAGFLHHRLVHHNYVSWRQFWSKQLRYARMEAQQLHAQGIRARPRNLVLQPLREFKRRYVTLEGHRAGLLGLQLSLVLAAANLAMYRELWHQNRASGNER
jgi:(heptosyl)LPS beta-1,4-glucosyltransferase